MAIYKGIEVENRLRPLLPHMHLVEEYRESLQSLQAVWDNLNLLGHLSGTTTEMSNTRRSFADLTSDLLNNLAERTLSRRVQGISAKAQVCIDILVRNLFERTADIGFLATDESIRQFASRQPTDNGAVDAHLNARFRAYIEKYSVYFDVVLLSPQGDVLERLHANNTIQRCTDRFIHEALTTSASYVESYAPSSLFNDNSPQLIYAYRVSDARGQTCGVLCLCFDLADEMQRIFSGLVQGNDWSVITLLDAGQVVIASSDPHLIPVGARLQLNEADGGTLRFAGRNYLASRRHTQGYQGYMGPGWSALALIPLEYAFVQEENELAAAEVLNHTLFTAILDSDSAFPAALKRIPCQAEAIQRELERSVWNGNIRQSSAGASNGNPAFSKILLAEISRTGLRMKEVFARSIGKLQETVVSSRLDDCRFLARLAIDIMDRNLYERANDCRWWALDPVLCQQLERSDSDAAREALSRRLSTINALYTVYDQLFIFDAERNIVATSRPQTSELVGHQVQGDWPVAALALTHTAQYTVSDFSPSPLYADRPSYIYSAALFDRQGKTTGGIGIVFDSEPQFSAMLKDALPGDVADAFGLFVDADGRIIAASDERFQAGAMSELPADLLNAAANNNGESRLIVFRGQVMAVGAHASIGYREYKGVADPYRNQVTALVFAPLGEYREETMGRTISTDTLEMATTSAAARGENSVVTIEIATFKVGAHWLGLPVREVLEAVELQGFTRIPNAPPQIFGSMIYQSAAVPLYNLHAALGMDEVEQAEEMQVIIINSEDSKPFGLLVDRLTSIHEVAIADIEPVSNIFVGITPVLASIVKAPKAGDNMLTLLSVASMQALLKNL